MQMRLFTHIYIFIYIYARMRIPPGRTQLRATSPTTPEAALGIQGYAFAQSVKLAVFETIVDASIEKVGNHGLVDRFFSCIFKLTHGSRLFLANVTCAYIYNVHLVYRYAKNMQCDHRMIMLHYHR